MAHIDTNAIEGFDAMDAEARLNAILALDIPDEIDLSQYVKKSVFDKTASDLAAAKKSLTERMTADEAAKAAKEAADAERDALIKELTRKTAIAENEKKLLGQGYSAALAAEIAEAMTDGDNARIIAAMAKHDAEREKAIRADMTRNNPKPNGGNKTDDGDGDDEKLALAKRLGKTAAERSGNTSSVLEHYLKKS